MIWHKKEVESQAFKCLFLKSTFFLSGLFWIFGLVAADCTSLSNLSSAFCGRISGIFINYSNCKTNILNIKITIQFNKVSIKIIVSKRWLFYHNPIILPFFKLDYGSQNEIF